MIDNLSECLVLYHGSFCEVQSPNLAKCSPFKDFGQGFYLTSDLTQARQFAKISTRKAKENQIIANQNYGIVSSFLYHYDKNLKIKIFPELNSEWLYCVVAHRKKVMFKDIKEKLKSYDILAGKIANDATNATIIAYISGLFGEIATQSADELCIQLLLPNRLKNQYCFRTENSLKSLEFIKSEKVEL